MLSANWYKDLVLTGRGCTAIALVLRGINKPGGQILVPANICEVVIATIRHEGYIPIYADVDPVMGNSERIHFEAAPYEKAVALLATPNFGSPIDMQAIRSFCDDNSLFLIEDLCNALGASNKGVPLGSYGDAVIYSFGYAKIIEHGIGGGLFIKDESTRAQAEHELTLLPLHSSKIEEAERAVGDELKRIRHSALKNVSEKYSELYDEFAPFLFFQLNDHQKSELIEKLQNHDLESNIHHRRMVASIYKNIDHDHLQNRPISEGDIVWRYCMLADSQEIRDRIVSHLRANGFIVSTWYPNVAELFHSDYTHGSLPGSEEFGSRVINLFVDHRISKTRAEETVKFIQNQLSIDSI